MLTLFFDASTNSAYEVTGTDRVTTHSSASNTIIKEGDTVEATPTIWIFLLYSR